MSKELKKLAIEVDKILKEELKKTVGDSEANRFEKTFTQHPIYEMMKQRLDLSLTDELQKRLDDLRKDILG